MKKVGKSITALLMAAALTGSMLPTTVLAADYDAEASSEYEEIEVEDSDDAETVSIDEETDADSDEETTFVDEEADVKDSDAEAEEVTEAVTDNAEESVTVAAEETADDLTDIVISEDQTIADETLANNVYIAENVILTTSGTVEITGNVYVFGTLENKGKLTISGTLYCLHYGSILSAGDYDYGYVNNSGSMTADSIVVQADYLEDGIPNSEETNSDETDLDDEESFEKIDISLATIAEIEDYTYTGSAFEPDVTVTYDNEELVSDTDYTVEYRDNTDAGTATVTVTGIGNYTGTATATFTIKAKSISSATVTLSATSYTYSGKAKKPTPTVKLTLNGSTTTLTKNTDYKVSYSDNTDVGKATVTIEGTGNFSGSVKKTFKINPKATSIKKLVADRNGFKVTWTEVTTQTTGYQIQYSTKSDFSSKTTKTITSNTTTSKSYPSLKANTKYYVRVRTYKTVSGTKYYSSWSSKKSIKTGIIVTKSNGKKYYKYADGTYAKSKFVTVSSKTYYFDSKGVMTTGWAKISGSYYYFDRSTGVEKKSTTVDGVKLKSSGKASATSAQKTMIDTMITARKVMLENTSTSDSKSAKLKKCFDWVLKHPYYRYRRLPEARTSATWLCTYANDEFKKGKGCCVSEACAFAFLAHECGYTAYVCDDTGHAWVEINGKVYDTLFAEAKSYSKYYGSSYKTAGLYRVNKTGLY